MNESETNKEPVDLRLEKSFQIIVDAFVNSSHLSRREFLAKVFESAFELIPGAEKGSYYELQGDLFHPIFAKGYNMNVLKRLAFSEQNIFISFEGCDLGAIEVFEFNNIERDETKYTDEEIRTFKELGTYGEFTTLYAMIRVDGANVGLLCFERFDGNGYSRTSHLIMKLYAQLISNFYSQLVHLEGERKRFDEIINAMVSAIELKVNIQKVMGRG